MNDTPTTKICNRCKVAKPLTDFSFRKRSKDGYQRGCKACAKAHYQATREQCLARQKAHRQAHPEKRAALQKAYRAAKKAQKMTVIQAPSEPPVEKRCGNCGIMQPLQNFTSNKSGLYGFSSRCRACAKLYYHANRTQLAQKEKVYREANKVKMLEQQKLYRLANPEKARVRNRKRRAQKQLAEGSYTFAEWSAKLALYKGRCHWCHKKIKGTPHADHVIALSKGGTNYIDNIVPSCAKCNTSKGAKTPLEFAGRLF